LKDVQNRRSNYETELTKVGILNLEYPVVIKRPDREHQTILEVKMSVNLPEKQKGVHMSRFIEKIEEDFKIPQETMGIENLAEKIALDQLTGHKYAKNALVELKTKRDYNKKIYKLCGSYDSQTGEKKVGVEVVGAIACPCSIEMTGGLSHNQRAIIKLELQTNDNEVDAEDLVEICEKSFSSPVRLMLKRPEEREIVEAMHENPMFVEDVVRKCVFLLKKKYGGCFAYITCISQESIHPFDVFAEWSGIL